VAHDAWPIDKDRALLCNNLGADPCAHEFAASQSGMDSAAPQRLFFPMAGRFEPSFFHTRLMHSARVTRTHDSMQLRPSHVGDASPD
jgi:hypothetical protein